MYFAKKYWITGDHRWNICVTPQMLVAVSFFVLTLPLTWLAAWFIAAAVHELSHLLAVILCEKQVYGLKIDICGAKIQTEPLTNGQTLLCTLAGPLGGFLLIPLGIYYPQLAICAFVLSVFNLLPVYPLDGGRILQSLLQILFHEAVASKICRIVTMSTILLLTLLSVGLSLRIKTLFPMLFVLIMLLQQGENKISLQINGSRSTIVLPK